MGASGNPPFRIYCMLIGCPQYSRAPHKCSVLIEPIGFVCLLLSLYVSFAVR